MRELGQVLRKQRETLGLDLDELQIRTKIRKRYLEALENGEWDVLPGVVYARGFIRSYAEALGLDGMKLLDEYIDHTSEKVESAFEKSKEPKKSVDLEASNQIRERPSSEFIGRESSSQEKITHDRTPNEVSLPSLKKPQPKPMAYRTSRSKSVKLLSGKKFGGGSQVAVVAGALVVIVAVLFVLKNHQETNKLPLTANTSNASNLNSSISGSNATVPGNQTVVANPLPNDSNSSVNTTGATGNSVGSNSTGNSNGTVQIVASPFTGRSENYAVTMQGSMKLALTVASGACWVSVTADGQIVDGNDIIAQGQTRNWTANQTITIRLGHVIGVQIQVNGQAVTLPSTNNPVTVTFTKTAK